MTIDLAALKEQLKLLGHNLPDSQVIAILKDMNIDFGSDDEDGGESDGADDDVRVKPPPGPGRTGSILDSFSTRPANTAAAPPAPQPQFRYGYTDPVPAAALGPAARPASGLRSKKVDPIHHHHQQHAHDVDAEEDTDDDGAAGGSGDDDVDGNDEPGLSCRHCTPPKPAGHNACSTSTMRAVQSGGNTATSGGAHGSAFSPVDARGPAAGRHAWAEPSLRLADSSTRLAPGSGGGYADDEIDAQMARSLERLAIERQRRSGHMPVTGSRAGTADPKGGNSAGMHTSKVPSSAFGSQQQHQPRPSSTSRVRDQAPKQAFVVPPAGGQRHSALASSRCGQARPLYDDDSDIRGAADRDRGRGVHDDWTHPQHQHQTQPPPPHPHQQQAGGRHAQVDPYMEYGWEGAGGPPRRSLSPQSSTRSFASRASASSRGGGRGSKKVDRVQRYHQMQAEWSQSKFLKQAGGQPARGTSRKPVNFHSHFAAMHAAEDADRQRLLRETRARTKKDLGAATEAPTANRRDELRWQTRMRMQEQA